LNPSPSFWQARYRQQVGWTQNLRRYALDKIGLSVSARLLEAGCAGGALLGALRADGFARLSGIDLDFAALQLLPEGIPAACADGQRLPFRTGSFDACLCHFYLLWVRDPRLALRELRRVTRPGGWLLALAEPHYPARVDRPPSLKKLGRLQTRALRAQGAHVDMGARLLRLFHKLGLQQVESGVLQPLEPESLSARERELEWAVLAADLEDRLPPAELERLRRLDQSAWRAGERVLHVPLHYALGRLPPEG